MAMKYYTIIAAGDPHGEGGHGEFNPIDIEMGLFLWFVVVFVAGAFILKRFAWKPILDSLDARETRIRDSIDNAEKLETELAGIEDKRVETIAAADAQAKSVLEEARKGAVEAERTIKAKAKEEAQILKENAYRDIKTAEEKAEAALKQESARVAVELAGKIIGENLDDDKNRALTDRLISEL